MGNNRAPGREASVLYRRAAKWDWDRDLDPSRKNVARRNLTKEKENWPPVPAIHQKTKKTKTPPHRGARDVSPLQSLSEGEVA